MRIFRKFFNKAIYTQVKYFNNIAALKPDDRLKQLSKMAKSLAREDPVIMKIDSPEFKAIFTDELNTLSSLFDKYGYEIRIAGGAVRDLLLGKTPKDLDFATTATPDQMKEIFTTENVRMINMKGEKHGTITPRINDKENFEVTTLRIDVVTDGRHAEVQYTTDWLLDSNRRDLTINSMFLGLDGSLYDYFYGYEDLMKRRIAFVGDANSRIQEDYLRILRYFRFYGRIAQKPNSHEDSTLEAIKSNSHGLKQISGERIWMELKKIMEGNFAGELVILMSELGLFSYIGLPEKPDIEEFKRVWKRSGDLKLQAITLLSALLKTESEAIDLHARLKFSAYERDLMFYIILHREPIIHENPLLPYKQLLLRTKYKTSDTKEWIVEILKYNKSPYTQEFKDWVPPKFPVNGLMLKTAGVPPGKFMGAVMNELKELWISKEFTLSAEELMQEVPSVSSRLEEKKKSK